MAATLDEQKLADRTAALQALRGPAALAADAVTLPARAAMGAANSVVRGANMLLPQGINIPFIPNRMFGGNPDSATPYSDAWNPPAPSDAAAAAAMPKTPPAPVVPAPVAAPTAAAAATPGFNTTVLPAAPNAAAATAPQAFSAPVAAATRPWSIEKTSLNSDGSAGKTFTVTGAAPAAAPGPNVTPGLNGGGAGGAGGAGGMPSGLLDPAAAAQRGVDQHVAYVERILPILQAAANNGNPGNASRRLDSLMHAFGNMNLAHENVAGIDTINSGRLGMATQFGVAGLHNAGNLAVTQQQGLNQLAEHATDSVQLGTELAKDPLTGMSIAVPTYGQRPTKAGMAPMPYSAAKPKPVIAEGATQSHQGVNYVYRQGQWVAAK